MPNVFRNKSNTCIEKFKDISAPKKCQNKGVDIRLLAKKIELGLTTTAASIVSFDEMA